MDQRTFDLVIQNARIVDGTGRSAFFGDVGISGGKIEAVGEIPSGSGKRVVDVKQSILAPGFIDVHSHGDGTMLLYPNAQSALFQGITTFVGGNCGFSAAPIKDKWIYAMWEQECLDEVEAHIFSEKPFYPLEKVNPVLQANFGLEIDWSSFSEFFYRVEEQGISVNYVPLIGHGQVFAQAMQGKPDRKPTEDEIYTMRSMVKEGMEAGAFGFSTGLDYFPGSIFSTGEIIGLLKEVKDYNGIYATHWRRTGPPGKKNKIEGIKEAVKIGEKTGMKLQISHLLPGYSIIPDPPEELERAVARETLKVVEEGLEKGIDLAFDVIPNTSGGPTVSPYIINVFSPWLKQAGSIEQFLKNLEAQDFREFIKKWLEERNFNPRVNPDWGFQFTVIEGNNSRYLEKTIAEIAKDFKSTPVEAMIKLIQEDPYIKWRQELVPSIAVKTFMQHPRSMVCTDGFILDDVGPWGQKREIPAFLPHPNTYCAFINYLLYFGEDRIEDSIRKMTGFPASFWGLKDQGVIEKGKDATLVVFDEKELVSRENFANPRNYPKGMEYVVVNGKVVIENGKHTGERPGKVLKRE